MTRDQPSPQVRIGLIEDYSLLRDALKEILTTPTTTVAFAARSATEAIDVMDRHPVRIVVLDLWLGRGSRDGLQILTSLRESYPATALVVFTGAEDATLAGECVAAGAAAFLTKAKNSAADLLEAVHAVARGERWVPLEAVEQSGGLAASSALAKHQPGIETLTTRERQVLCCIAEGHDNLKASTQLGITERTVKAHVTALYRKLGAENRVQLALMARRAGYATSGT